MPLLKVEHLRKSYGKNEAVKGISFTIESGRCVTLLGPNGAGKTTTLSMLAGLLQPTSGHIQFMDIERGDIRRYIGYLPQYPAFYNWMSGKEFLVYVGKLANLSTSQARKRTDDVLQLVGLYDARNRKIGGYSGGMKQRLGIAQSLIHQPKLLILDEPVSALDPIGRREVLEMIKQIKEETTILFSTHVLHDAEEVSEDVLIMNQGEIILAGELTELMRSAVQPIIHIEGETDMQKWITSFTSLPYVERVDYEGEHVHVLLSNLQLGKQEVLKTIIAYSIPIRKFEIATSTLEDLFLKVVGS